MNYDNKIKDLEEKIGSLFDDLFRFHKTQNVAECDKCLTIINYLNLDYENLTGVRFISREEMDKYFKLSEEFKHK